MSPQRNRKYLAFVRSQPCCVCGSTRGVEAAHTGPHGLGQKSPDSSCIPLCRTHHTTGNDSYHALGPWRFAEYHQLNIPAWIAKLNREGLTGQCNHRIRRRERSPEFTRFHCVCGWRSAWYRIAPDAEASLNRHTDEQNKQELLDYVERCKLAGEIRLDA